MLLVFTEQLCDTLLYLAGNIDHIAT